MGLKNIKVENQTFVNQRLETENIKGEIRQNTESKEEKTNKKGIMEKSLVETGKKTSKFKNLSTNAKEIALVIVAFGLIGLGYLNYSPEESVQVAAYQNEENLGDAKLVSSSAIVENDEELSNAKSENVGDTTSKSTGNAENSVSSENAETNQESNLNTNSINTGESLSEQDYFSLSKLERDTMYSQTLETYQKMLDNEKLTNEQKAIAIQEISKITEEKNAIQISENLIKNKGYEDVVILKNSENVNVIVKAKKIETEDVAKIQNIITRELKVDLDKINISCR